jgi:hypothetical protein
MPTCLVYLEEVKTKEKIEGNNETELPQMGRRTCGVSDVQCKKRLNTNKHRAGT